MASKALENPLLHQDEDALLSAREVATLLSYSAPLPTNSAIIALSKPFKLLSGPAPLSEVLEGELKQAMSLTQIRPQRQQELLAVYRTYTTNVMAFSETLAEYRYKRQWASFGLYETPSRPKLAAIGLPEDMPEEFRLFSLAFQNYLNGEMPEAREKLGALLDLPPNRRSYRTFWAKAVMSDTYAESDPARTLADFKLLRSELMEKGNSDARLASFLLRCEANAYSSVTNYPQSLNCFFALNLLGWRDLGAMRRAASLIMRSDDATLDVAARGEAVSAFVSWHGATLFSNPRQKTLEKDDKEAVTRWLVELQKKGLLKSAPDYAAVAAYRAENLDLAKEAASLAPATSYVSAWILAKCKLAEQDLVGGVSDLATLYYGYSLPEDAKKGIGRELALLYLSSQRYQESLKILLQEHHWKEAAYVAEKVLTTKELINFVRERRRLGLAGLDEEQESKLSYLLARRLMRQMDFPQAAPYFPSLRLNQAAQLVASMAMGTNLNLSAKQRGLAWADAARAFYYGGEPLVATENEPDWFCSNGENCRPETVTRRQLSRLAPVSEEENLRISQNSPRLNCQDFCLENAVSQVWKAAYFLPDNSSELAELLREAGAWTENRDAVTARKLYDTLINRCPNTDLGREAQELHWFPKKQ